MFGFLLSSLLSSRSDNGAIWISAVLFDLAQRKRVGILGISEDHDRIVNCRVVLTSIVVD